MTDWRDRAQTGIVLAADASNPAALDQLVGLLLDPGDTAVTDQTARALLRRGDVDGLRPIAKAWASADNDEYRDHIYGQLIQLLPGAIAVLVEHCTVLLNDSDPATAAGASQLLTIAQPWAQTTHGQEP